jgi:cation diffusion facilitator CzcD-associated flavoprotein CzcO
LTLGDLPPGVPKQPHILANLAPWVERSGLADGIRLDSPRSRARYTGTCGEFDTPQGMVHARHLVAATGGQNTAETPDVLRRESEVRELHSSALRVPAELTGREVLVVGGARESNVLSVRHRNGSSGPQETLGLLQSGRSSMKSIQRHVRG